MNDLHWCTPTENAFPANGIDTSLELNDLLVDDELYDTEHVFTIDFLRKYHDRINWYEMQNRDFECLENEEILAEFAIHINWELLYCNRPNGIKLTNKFTDRFNYFFKRDGIIIKCNDIEHIRMQSIQSFAWYSMSIWWTIMIRVGKTYQNTNHRVVHRTILPVI